MPTPLIVILIASLVAYVLGMAALYILQPKLIFRPPPINPQLRPSAERFGVDVEDITIKTGEGTIHGWWVPLSKDASKRSKAPTVLYFHGNAVDLTLLGEVAAIFNKFGWNALMFDYRGFGFSDKPTAGLIDQASVVADGMAAYDWLIQQGISESKIFFWGHSLGSSIAAHVAKVRAPRALILEGAFTNIVEMARLLYFPLPIFSFLVREKFDTRRVLQDLRIPKLFIHGEEDFVVPLKFGQRVFKAASEPKQFMMIAKIGHSDLPSVAMQYKSGICGFVNGSLEEQE